MAEVGQVLLLGLGCVAGTAGTVAVPQSPQEARTALRSAAPRRRCGPLPSSAGANIEVGLEPLGGSHPTRPQPRRDRSARCTCAREARALSSARLRAGPSTPTPCAAGSSSGAVCSYDAPSGRRLVEERLLLCDRSRDPWIVDRRDGIARQGRLEQVSGQRQHERGPGGVRALLARGRWRNRPCPRCAPRPVPTIRQLQSSPRSPQRQRPPRTGDHDDAWPVCVRRDTGRGIEGRCVRFTGRGRVPTWCRVRQRWRA